MDVLLAVNNFGDTESGGLAGPLGLLFIVLLGIATVLLIRNMNTRLRRLPDHFPGQQDDDRTAAAGESVDIRGAGPEGTAGRGAADDPH
jgi:hypothetical protein